MAEVRGPIYILIGGRRYSGKDYVAAALCRALGCSSWAFASQLKREYAKQHGADAERLHTDAEYKELHRQGLIDMAMAARERDPQIWARKLDEQCGAVVHTDSGARNIVVISDYRFANEYEYFAAIPGATVLTVQVRADDDTRRNRGWKYNPDVDNSPSERGEGLARHCSAGVEHSGWYAEVQNGAGVTHPDLLPIVSLFAEI